MPKRKEVRRVALAVPTGVPHVERIVRGISRYASQHGQWEFIVGPDALVLSPRDLRGWSGDGIIGRINTKVEVRTVLELNVPAVNCSGALRDAGVPRVTVDNQAVGRLAAEHLVQCGFHRYAYYGVRGLWYAQQRGVGFDETIKAAGGICSVLNGLSTFTSHQIWERVGEELQHWLASLTPPVGVFACSDYRARMVLEACEQLDLRVPDDVAVVGVNNDEIACEFCDPPLTSVSYNGGEIGYQLAALLDRLMAGRKASAKEVFIQPDGVVRRRSTDTLAIEDPQVAVAVQFIRDHFSEPIDVAEVVRQLDVSRRWLEHTFQQSVGHTPHEFICHVRVERAKQLLASGKKVTMSEVAQKCGFSDAQRLRLVFQRFTGISPHEYHRRHSRKTD